jgi:hypothetical protein
MNLLKFGLAMKHGDDFALLIHGTQPAGSEVGKAVSKLRRLAPNYS